MNLTIRKKQINILLCTILISFAYGASAQEFEVFLFEDFEHGGQRPSGWSELNVIGTREWRYEDGGYAPTGAPTFRHPANAYSGDYNALFQDESIGPKRKLITPAIDLRTSIKPTLVFWHAQDQWGESTDELRVFYSKTKEPYVWVQLEHFNTPTPNWTKREIILPDAVKVQKCYIAFEGLSNWGWGVCIDDVKIEERGLLPRTVESFVVKQQNNIFPSGSNINSFSYLRAYVSGNSGEIPVNSIKFNFTGTNINDISNISLYHTRDSLFSITTPVTAGVSYNGNEVTLTAPSFNLLTGDNYLWICFDIKSTAIFGNTIDFTLGANSVQLGNATFPTTAKDPIQFATIHSSILLDDFENANTWTNTSLWQIGVPTGIGIFDPAYAYSGNNVLATNLSGNYPSSITPDNPQTAKSSSIDAKYYQNLSVFYKRWLNIEYFDRTSLSLSTDEESTWIKLFESNSDILDRRWRSVSHNISAYATRKESLKVKFSIDTTNQITEYGGWNIDNFAITGEFIHSDVGILSKLLPVQGCGLTSTEIVRITIKNFGGATVSTPFEVGYSLNGGASYTKEMFNGPINSEEQVVFTFATPANLTSPGLKNMVFRTFLTGDQDPTNNAFNQNLYVFPAVTFPYETSFESSTAYWYPSGLNSSWQWGSPSGQFINKASNGTKAWVTNLSQNYKNNELSYLESPCFDLTSAQYPIFSFDYLMQVEEGSDGMYIEYSIDGGHAWNALPENVNYANNWYDTETVAALGARGWSINKPNYVTAKTLLPSDAVGKSGVKFRFVFASNTSQTFEGVAIDMVKVYELPYDLGVSSLISPTDDCEIGNGVTLELRLTNFGYRPIPIGVQVPVNAKVDDGVIKTETITYSGPVPLTQNSTFDITTVNTFNIFSAGIHQIKAFTNLAIDDNRLNDTLTTPVNVYGMPSYSIGADIGTMQTDTVVLNAGAGYASYIWYKFNDPTWDLIPGEVTYQYNLPDLGWGLYSVLVTNGLGCTASDTIEVAQSDKNVGITAIHNISDECEHTTLIHPEVTITSFNTGTFDGTEVIPLIVKINDEIVLSEELIPEDGWGGTANIGRLYTFTGTIDLSEVGEYNIAIYTDMSKDLNRINDTTTIAINTWGIPLVETFVQIKPSVFEIAASEIVSTSADTLVFKATEGFSTYLWERQQLGQTSWVPCGTEETLYLSTVSNNLVSAYYRVIAIADHGCGEDTSTIFVNAADLAVSSIYSPIASACETAAPTPLSIVIKNVGYEIYPIGTEIQATVITPFGNQTETITLTNQLLHNEQIGYEFPVRVQFPIGDHYINFSIENDNDPNAANNTMELLSRVKPSPWVTLEPDSLFRIFGPEETYSITPTYSEDVISYLWHDGDANPDYLIWGPPLYVNYIVVAKNSSECSASDTLVVISSDLEVTNIVSPKNDCVLTDETPVTFMLYNNGNYTYPVGTQINVSLFLDGNFVIFETIVLPVNLASKSSTNINLVQKLNLEGRESATIQVDVKTNITEVFDDNNSKNKTVYALGYPTITLGPDREVHAWEEILDPGYYEFYAWQDASGNRTFSATEDGTYSVTVTDFTGCQGYAEVDLVFFIDDIEITDIVSPISGCGLSSDEPVTITFKNSGTFNFDAGTILTLGFSLGGTTYTEELVLVEAFDVDDEMTVTLGQTVNLSQPKTHNMQIWVEVANDMIPDNSNIAYPVDSYPPVNFSFNLPDEISTYLPYTLDAGADYVSYLWQNGSTQQTFTATETGVYHVTVTDENGCTGYDEVYISFNKSDINIVEVITPASEQCRVPNMPIEITLKNKRSQTINIGAELIINCVVGFTTPVEIVETLTLTQALQPDDEINYVFNQTLNFQPNNSYELTFRVDYEDVDGNTYFHTTNVNPSPSVDLGPETAHVTFPYTLVAGVGGVDYLWSTGGTTSSIETYQSGSYWIVVTNSFGCTASDTIYLTDGSWVHEIPGKGSIKVYPNPVRDILTVEVDAIENNKFNVEVISPIGQKVHHEIIDTYQKSTAEINVQHYSPGIYLLRVSSQGKWITLKVIIN
ncbi:MAG: T9SS type A sorting domain-containing protein [Bacteroidales bacterium]|nr:T9SS type A sorting domain-containing protein [Bacteroidales bacterium]